MSHEDPDIEAPPADKLEAELVALGAEPPEPSGQLRGEITWQVIVSGVLVAVIMGARIRTWS